MLPVKVLFLCTGNSCRSQMAEGLLRHIGKAAVEVASAGTRPQPVHPRAIRAMEEIGLDISGQRSKPAEEFLDQRFDYVITLCDDARESCPAFAAAAERIHWGLPDPALIQGTEEQSMEAFRTVRDSLSRHVCQLQEEIFASVLEEISRSSAAACADASLLRAR